MDKQLRGGDGRTSARDGTDELTDLAAVWSSLQSLRQTVENDHDHRLRRIELDLRWVIVLLGGEIMALVGAAVSGVVGG